MKKHIKKGREFGLCVASFASEHLTEATKHVRFSPNAVSRAMDTANGGVLKHGGFHRVFGGHSIVDVEMWQQHGFRFAKEVGRDSFTRNGVPLPGVETMVNKGWIKASMAQDWGSLSIGDAFASGLALLDTGLSTRKFVKDRKAFREKSNRVFIKGGIKLATALTHSNLPLAILGSCDIGMALYAKMETRKKVKSKVTVSSPVRAKMRKGLKTRAAVEKAAPRRKKILEDNTRSRKRRKAPSRLMRKA